MRHGIRGAPTGPVADGAHLEATGADISAMELLAALPSANRSGVGFKREQIWCRAAIELHRARVDRYVAERQLGTAARRARALERDGDALSSSAHPYAPLYAFLLILHALELHQRESVLDRSTVARLHRRALAILRDHGVRPRTSRVAFLHAELHALMCRIEAKDGDAWRAEWHAAIARRHVGSSPAPSPADAEYDELLSRISLGMELGLAQGAAARLLEAELPDAPDASIAALRLARSRILRLGGRLDAAWEVLESLSIDDEESALFAELLWERACVESVRTKSLEPQARLLRVRPDARAPRRLLQLFLWRRAVSVRRWMKAPPKAASLRRSAAHALDPVVLRFAQTLERCYAGRGDVPSRVAMLGRALADVESVAHVDDQLLVWASAARWLHRAKQGALVPLPLTRYRALCCGLASDASDDVLSVLDDLPSCDEDDVPTASDFRFTAACASPPIGRFARTASVSLMGASMTRVVASNLAARAIGGDSEELRRQAATEYGEIAAQYMGRLKGPLMKLGQIMSFYGFELPEEAAAALSTLQDAAPAVEGSHIVGTVEQDLGAPIEHLFRRFDARPLATGSIGQVHAAELPDGTQVVVKVRYPGMPETIEADLDNLEVLAPVLRRLMPRWDVSGLMREVGHKMRQECDYRLEAASQLAFRHLLRDEPAMHVPDVFLSHSAERVLTSERVFGETFPEFCAHRGQAERDAAGETLVRYAIRTCMMERAFNTDMHPGNLLFTPGVIHFVDFGSVKRWEPHEGHGWRSIVEAVLSSDHERFGNALLDLGLARPEDELDFRWAYDTLVDNIMKCVAEDRVLAFDADAVLRDVKLWLLDHEEARKLSIPPPYLLCFRLYWGMFAIISALGARTNWRRLVSRILEAHPLDRAA